MSHPAWTRIPSALCLALYLAAGPSPTLSAAAGEKEDRAAEVKEAGKIVDNLRVLAFDLPPDENVATGGRVVLVRLDRPEQIILKLGQDFDPAPGYLFTLRKINKDGSVYVSGSGLSMARIKVATKAEREAWQRKRRSGGSDS
jgi:hypothetical protein